jgi:hypothetical protein
LPSALPDPVFEPRENRAKFVIIIILLLLTAIGLMPGGSEYNTIT